MPTVTCKHLAQRYAKELSSAIPASNAATSTREDWLLTQEWGCYINGFTGFQTSPTCEDENDPDVDTGSNISTLNVRPPMLNSLKEEGFLDWVNQRGMQCVNKIIGNFYGLDESTGLAKQPSRTEAGPTPQCWGVCYKATTESSMCFECIKNVLLTQPSLCPSINAASSADDSLLHDCIECHECMGLQGKFVPLASSPTLPNNDAMVNNAWKCITGDVGSRLSRTDWIIIIVVLSVVVILAIALGVYYGYVHPRIVAANKRWLELNG